MHRRLENEGDAMRRALPIGCESWVRPRERDAKAQLRLICFPYAGGGAWIYRMWPEMLPERVEVLPIELPGRGTRMREAPISDLEEIVRCALDALSPYLERPFAFFGHSMGGVLAFEMARELRRRHWQLPAHLFLSASRPPHLPRSGAMLHQMSDAMLINTLERFNGTPGAVLDHPEWLLVVLPTVRADFRALETFDFRPEPRLACPTTVFGGTRDRIVRCTELESWREITEVCGPIQLLPAEHFFVSSHRSLFLTMLLEELHGVLGRLESNPSRRTGASAVG